MEYDGRPHHAAESGEVTPNQRRTRFRDFALTESDNALLHQIQAPHREILTASGSYEQISRALHIPPGTVRSRLHRARAALTALRKKELAQ